MKCEYFSPETGSYETVKCNLPFLNYCLLKSFLREAVKQLSRIHMQGSQEPCADYITLPHCQSVTFICCTLQLLLLPRKVQLRGKRRKKQ